MKYCNPDTCSECLYIGEGDSICEISHELVLDNWQSVPHTIPQECPFRWQIIRQHRKSGAQKMNETVKQPLDLPFGAYEPQLSASIDLERYLSSEVLLHVFDLSGTHEVKTCYGDVVKIVNALRDYAKLLETVCDEWDLGGFHRATYEYQAEKLRQIADKLQRGIGYDYDDAVRKCQKLRRKKLRNADVGEEAMVLAVKRGFEQAQAKANKPSSPGQNDDKEVNRYE